MDNSFTHILCDLVANISSDIDSKDLDNKIMIIRKKYCKT